MHNLHIGIKKAFGDWLLLWVDNKGNAQSAKISARAAKKLISHGMSHEG
jgi:hypothetical protein